jgi:hypothetical protein
VVEALEVEDLVVVEDLVDSEAEGDLVGVVGGQAGEEQMVLNNWCGRAVLRFPFFR